MHARNLWLKGRIVGRMLYNSDFSGTVTVIVHDGGQELAIPGDIIEGIREDALSEAKDAADDLFRLLGMDDRAAADREG